MNLKRFVLSFIFVAVVFSGCSYVEGYKYCKAHPDTCGDQATADAKEKAAEVRAKIETVSKPLIETAINSSGVVGAGVVSKPVASVGSVLLGAAGGAVAFPFLQWFFMGTRGRKQKKEEEENNSK